MSNPGSNVHFWNHLLSTAELIETVDRDQARSMVMEQLSTIGEAFSDCADPVESFEEYVVIKLTQAVYAALAMDDEKSHAPGSPT